MKTFKVLRKSDGKFVSYIKGRKLFNRTVGRTFDYLTAAVSIIFASDEHAKHYSVIEYHDGEPTVCHLLNSTWGQ